MTTAQLAVITLSLVGSLLFVAAGFLIARSGIFPALSPQFVSGRAREEALLADLSATRRHTRTDGGVTRKGGHPERGGLPDSDARIARSDLLENERAALEEQQAALKSMIDELHKKNEAAQEKERKFAAKLKFRETEIETLQAKEARLNERLAESGFRMQELTAKLAQRQAEIEALREQELGWNQQRSESAGRVRDLTVKVRGLEDDRQDLLVQLERLTPRLAEVDRYRRRVEALEADLLECDDLRRQIDTLRRENTRLESLELIHQTPKAAPARSLEETSAVFGDTLDSLLASVTSSQGSRGAVIADEDGFLVAGIGDHLDALGVVAALCDEMAGKVPGMLPVSAMKRTEIVDENDVTIRVEPFAIASDRLILVSLSVGPGPDHGAVDSFFRQTSSVMAADSGPAPEA